MTRRRPRGAASAGVAWLRSLERILASDSSVRGMPKSSSRNFTRFSNFSCGITTVADVLALVRNKIRQIRNWTNSILNLSLAPLARTFDDLKRSGASALAIYNVKRDVSLSNKFAIFPLEHSVVNPHYGRCFRFGGFFRFQTTLLDMKKLFFAAAVRIRDLYRFSRVPTVWAQCPKRR